MTDSRNSLANAPYLHEYFGVWCITEETARAMYCAAMNLDLQRHLAARQEIVRKQTEAHLAAVDDDGPRYYRTSIVAGGLAVVEVGGTLMKQASSMGNDTSTVRLRQTMRALARDERVAGVMLVMESPGGTVAGTMDLAADVAALAAAKPVHVYADGLMASAAYWVGSQASVISAGADAIVGSIGTFATVYDYSGLMAKEGIKAYVIRAGEFKGMGVPGTELTEPQRAEMQRTVNALNEHFLAGVASGRRITVARARELNDGRVHVGEASKAMGLIDHVETLDSAMSRLRAAVTTSKPKQRVAASGAAGLLIAAAGKSPSDGPKVDAIPPASAGATTEDRMGGANNGTAPEQQAGQTQEQPKTPANQQQTAPAAPAAPADAPKAATAAEIDAACPGASSDFKLDCLRSGHTLAQTKDAFIGWQSAQLRSRDEESAKATAAHADAIKSKDEQIGDLTQRLKNAGGLMETSASEQRKTTPDAPADPKAQAEGEWESNFESCQSKFSNKANFVAWRSNDIKRSRRR